MCGWACGTYKDKFGNWRISAEKYQSWNQAARACGICLKVRETECESWKIKHDGWRLYNKGQN